MNYVVQFYNTVYEYNNFFLVFISIVFFIGCGSDEKTYLVKENQELKSKIASLESERDQLKNEISDLNKQLVKYTSNQEDGLKMEEERKALNQRETNISKQEQDLTRKQEEIRLREQEIRKKESEFYEQNKITLQDIGEAKQIKADEEYRKQQLEKALNTQGKVYVWNYILIVFCIIIGISFCIAVMVIRHRNHRINTAMEIVKNSVIDPHQKEILAQTLCRPLITDD